MDKELHIQTSEIQQDGKDTYYFHRYEPTSYEVLEVLFDELKLEKGTGFVDYGCGMGRLNFYIHHMFHCRSVGVEINSEYYNKALKNLETYCKYNKNATKDILFHLKKAEEYVICQEDTVFYFFNPFSIEIFQKVITNIQRSLEENWRDIMIILYYPDYEYLYFLEEFTNFYLYRRIIIDKTGKDEREGFLVFKQ